ncbi:hypothetical protein E4U31_006624 [Claviceps sp. LM219 group G6]|nr:hypothetical protein E4U31_006624 [Claviceps sp. LM219 group G6]
MARQRPVALSQSPGPLQRPAFNSDSVKSLLGPPAGSLAAHGLLAGHLCENKAQAHAPMVFLLSLLFLLLNFRWDLSIREVFQMLYHCRSALKYLAKGYARQDMVEDALSAMKFASQLGIPGPHVKRVLHDDGVC